MKQRIGTVLDWCYAKGYRPSEAPMRSLARGLPRQPRKDGHFAAMDYGAVPGFLADLQDRKRSISRLALELLILTATRSGEVRGARWDELNDDCTIWTIPAGRMKVGKVHAIPLSPQAADIFRQASHFRIAGNDLVFPGQRRKAPMSDMTLLQLLRGMNVNVTAHGFRSSFRDWVADKTDFPREVAEAALAHTLENKVEAAYRRTDFFEKRRALMKEWGQYCRGQCHAAQAA